eukprot:Em0023g193a
MPSWLQTHLLKPRPIALLLITATIGVHGNSAQPKLKLLSLPAPIAGMLYSVTCAVQDHPLNQVPAIEWVGPNNQALSTNGNVVIGIPMTTSTTTSRFLLFKVLSLADSGTYKCRSNGTMPPFQLVVLDVQAGFNDCSLNLQQCGPFSSCKTVDEISTCICNPGFVLNNSSCQDVDECNLLIHACPKNSLCRNTLGAYDCVCEVGFQPIGGNCITAGAKGNKGFPRKTGGASQGPIKIRHNGGTIGFTKLRRVGGSKGPHRSRYVSGTKRPKH